MAMHKTLLVVDDEHLSTDMIFAGTISLECYLRDSPKLNKDGDSGLKININLCEKHQLGLI